MSLPTLCRVAAGSAAALAALAAVPAHAIPAIALTTTNELFSFDTATPMMGSAPVMITGLGAGERIVGIDMRPTTNMLYGVSNSGSVYSIGAFGVASFVGMLDMPLGSSALGVDFNPVADLAGGASLRVISNTGQNYAFNVNNGTNAGGEGAIPGGHPSVAYANNDTNASTGTSLYYIDTMGDMLKRADSNFNNTAAMPITIVTVGALGVDANGVSGFDIMGMNTAYAAFMDADTGKSMLYGIDLMTGAATAMGSFGYGGSTIMTPAIAGIAVTPIPEPGTTAMLLAGLAAIGGLVRRRGTAR